MPSTGSRTKAPTKKAPLMPIKGVELKKGTQKMAAKQPPGKRTMIGGKNRNQKGPKQISDDTPV